jgi:hypothetical protein
MNIYRKLYILLVLCICYSFVTADICEESVQINTNCTMVTPSISCASYTYDIYNETGDRVENGSLTQFNDTIYFFNFTLGEGSYIVKLCDGTTREVYVKTKEESNMILFGIIMLPMLLAIIFIIASIGMGDDHAVLKISLFLLAPVLFFVSLHASMLSLIKVYNFPEMQEFIGTTSYWFGWFLFVLFSYFFIYFIYKAFRIAAQEKKERLEY